MNIIKWTFKGFNEKAPNNLFAISNEESNGLA